MIKRTKKMYTKYYREDTAEIKMSFKLWKIAMGRKRLQDQKYRKLNDIRKKFAEKEKKKYGYVTIKDLKHNTF